MGTKDTEAQRLSELRQTLWVRGMAIIGLLIATLVFFSLTPVQAQWLPGWLTEHWDRVVAATVLIIIGMLIGLPIFIEANINTRVLNGPGHVPRGGSHGGKPPLGG